MTQTEVLELLEQADEEYWARLVERYDTMDPKNQMLKGVTQVIVKMSKNKDLAEKHNIYAVISVCFGTTEDDAISQIYVTRGQSRTEWRLPQVVISGKAFPVFEGKIAEELSTYAHEAWDAIHKDQGKPKFGHKYRITNGRAVDLTADTTARTGTP